METMTTPPRTRAKRASYHHGDLASALKALAMTTITAQGVERFSVRDVADQLGVAPSAVYRHFQDKAALVRAVALDGFARLGQTWLDLMAVSEASALSDPATRAVVRFAAGADAYIMFAQDNPALFQLMYGPYGTGGFGVAGVDALGELSPYKILSTVLDELCQAGVITPASRINAEVKALAPIHGAACLMVSGVFDGLTPEARQAQLALVKDNVFVGLVATLPRKYLQPAEPL